jgi:Reverse transcriptase (RNA-dependent DNA polymerase)
VIKHKIIVSDPKPVASKLYRFPKVHEAEVNTQIKKMLKKDVIKPSTSPYNAPLWVVKKKSDDPSTQKWRVVVDYRYLNQITVGDAFPIPRIEEILDQLGQSCYFTTLDLAEGFHQVKMDEQDANKTAFSTPSGHYEFNRMPFGLKNTPATF